MGKKSCIHIDTFFYKIDNTNSLTKCCKTVGIDQIDNNNFTARHDTKCTHSFNKDYYAIEL